MNIWQCIGDLLVRGAKMYVSGLRLLLGLDEPAQTRLPELKLGSFKTDLEALRGDSYRAFHEIVNQIHIQQRKEAMKNSRFDYIAYDDKAKQAQANAKIACQALEAEIDKLNNGRAKALALTKLEEVYMWIGKAVRDEQVERGESDVVLQESRGNE